VPRVDGEEEPVLDGEAMDGCPEKKCDGETQSDEGNWCWMELKRNRCLSLKKEKCMMLDGGIEEDATR
jgi:hypothetical protein